MAATQQDFQELAEMTAHIIEGLETHHIGMNGHGGWRVFIVDEVADHCRMLNPRFNEVKFRNAIAEAYRTKKDEDHISPMQPNRPVIEAIIRTDKEPY